MIDDFVIEFGRNLKTKDFIVKHEDFSKNRKGKRQYLNAKDTSVLTKRLNDFFESVAKIPRIMHGERQEIEILTSEEALLFAKYLRNERPTWNPRLVALG